MLKRTLLSTICAMLLLWSMVLPSHALEGHGVVGGLRWFPCEPMYQNDVIWEAECVDPTSPFPGDTWFQSFDMTPDDTGYANLLATGYDKNGGLTLTRTDLADDEQLTASIRTVVLDYGCIIDPSADTLYYDIDADNCEWNIGLTFENAYTIRLGHLLAQTGDDHIHAPSGRYSGAVNVRTLLETLASDTDPANASAATAILELEPLYTPRIQITYSGGMGGALTLHSLFIAPADDPNGDACKTVALDLIFPSTDCNWDAPYITVTPLEDLAVPTAKSTVTSTQTTAPTSVDNSSPTISSVFIAVPCLIALAVAGTIIWCRKHR